MNMKRENWLIVCSIRKVFVPSLEKFSGNCLNLYRVELICDTVGSVDGAFLYFLFARFNVYIYVIEQESVFTL